MKQHPKHQQLYDIIAQADPELLSILETYEIAYAFYQEALEAMCPKYTFTSGGTTTGTTGGYWSLPKD